MEQLLGHCYGDPQLYNWQEALSYCYGLPHSNHRQWRLPTRNELLALVDSSRRVPAVAPALVTSTFPNVYWSSTTFVDLPSQAYYVSMFSGYSYPNYKFIQGFVRCIQNP